MPASDADRSPDLDVGFTLGLDMPFAETVAWADEEGFDFVELLLDGPYARERIEDRAESMRATLSAAGLDVVVHLPFAVDPGSPFTPVREGAVAELTAGMDLAAALGAECVAGGDGDEDVAGGDGGEDVAGDDGGEGIVVFHPSSDAWEKGWDTAATRAFVHDALDDLVPAARERDLEPCLENVVASYYDATTFDELLDRYPEASMTFDTSHALLAGMAEPEMAAFLREHADRVGHLHLVDTRGGDDEHLPVGMGAIDFDVVLDALADVGWAGTATLEIGTTDLDTIALGRRNLETLLQGR